MASLITNNFKKMIMNGGIDLDTDTFKVMLCTSSYTPSQDNDDFINDASSAEVTGTNYTAGGATLGSTTVTQDNTNNRGVFDAADASWTTASIANIHYIVVYKDTGTPATSPIVAVYDIGSDVTVINGTFTVQWHADGLLYIG